MLTSFASRPPQPAGQAVDITKWAQHDDFAVFPVESKPKRMLICPADVREPFLIPGHSYLFKTARGWQCQQVWSEVIAYKIGAELGLAVPPCFIAVDAKTGETGALVEFFYGYPGDAAPARLVPASDFMTRVLVDKKRGRPHTMRINLKLSRLLCKHDSVVTWWAEALAFDALIGNTDRHPDNWGYLFRVNPDGRTHVEMAPLFDNGTSLGYEVREEKLLSASSSDCIEAYTKKGTHHCGLDRDGPASHFELCKQFLKAQASAGPPMQSVIRYDRQKVKSIVEECTRFDVGICFSDDRARLVLSLLDARKAALRAFLEG